MVLGVTLSSHNIWRQVSFPILAPKPSIERLWTDFSLVNLLSNFIFHLLKLLVCIILGFVSENGRKFASHSIFSGVILLSFRCCFKNHSCLNIRRITTYFLKIMTFKVRTEIIVNTYGSLY